MSITQVEPQEKTFATAQEAAAFLNVSIRSIHTMMSTGHLEYVRLPGLRLRRIPWTALNAIAAATVGPAE